MVAFAITYILYKRIQTTCCLYFEDMLIRRCWLLVLQRSTKASTRKTNLRVGYGTIDVGQPG